MLVKNKTKEAKTIDKQYDTHAFHSPFVTLQVQLRHEVTRRDHDAVLSGHDGVAQHIEVLLAPEQQTGVDVFPGDAK